MANRSMKLTAPPGPKVRSGVKAPVAAPAREAASLGVSEDEDDDLVIEGGPTEGVKVGSGLVVRVSVETDMSFDCSSLSLASQRPPDALSPVPVLDELPFTPSSSAPPLKGRSRQISFQRLLVLCGHRYRLCSCAWSFGPAPNLSNTPVTSTSA